MKKLGILFVITFVFHLAALSQCLPNGIVFESQGQIDNFQTDYPGCTEIEGDVVIEMFSIEDVDLSGLSVLKAINGNLNIQYNNKLLNLSGLDSLVSVGGNLHIDYNESLNSLKGLDNLTSVGGYLRITQNESLTEIVGLGNLVSVGSHFLLEYNPVLTSLEGLNTLNTIGWYFQVKYNDALINFEGLNSLDSIGLYFLIERNAALLSFKGLDHLSAIDGYLQIRENPELTSLSGIDNIDSESISYAAIQNNPNLSTCAIKSICDLLPVGCIIGGNKGACHDLDDVVAACENLSGINEAHFLSQLSVYPNPSSNSTTIEYNIHQSETVQISIFNHLGERVDFIQERQSPGKQQVIWEAKDQPSGMYYFIIQVGNEGAQRKILIVR